MKQIRHAVFETNSSSVHAITICTAQEYKEWAKGKRIYDWYTGKLVPCVPGETDDEERFYTQDHFNDYFYDIYEPIDEEYTTPNGEKIVVFGYYGRD